MVKKIFFSFHYSRDEYRVSKVISCKAMKEYQFEFEKLKGKSDKKIKKWIEGQLKNTSVTVVLIGNQTANRKWVKYEIKRSIELDKGLIGIDISEIEDENGKIDKKGPNPLSSEYPTYLWHKDNGKKNLGKWVEKAVKKSTTKDPQETLVPAPSIAF